MAEIFEYINKNRLESFCIGIISIWVVIAIISLITQWNAKKTTLNRVVF